MTPTVPTDLAGDRAEGEARHTSLRRSLTTVLVAVSLVSVALLGTFNYLEARSLLTETVEAQLSNQQATQARAIATGLQAVGAGVSVAAADRGVVAALTDFSAAFAELADTPDLLSADDAEGLTAYYDGSVQPALDELGLGPFSTESLLPASDAGRYLQYHYIALNDAPAGERDELIEAPGDTTSYGTTHATHHPWLRELQESLGFDDMLLIDSERTAVVYSTEKLGDLGRSLEAQRDLLGGLARAVTVRLAAAPVGQAVFVDFEPYLPRGGEPVLFAAAAVRNEARVIGAVAFHIPIEALNQLTTAGGEWEASGLGETGEVYVVGPDGLMRSESRLWLTDPDAYLTRLENIGTPPEVVDTIVANDTTVLGQPVDTEAVETVFDGSRFVGRSSNYLERDTLTVAGAIDFEDLDWVVVADIAASEADASLDAFTRRILLLAAILIPLVGVAGVYLANRITRPIEPVVDAAADIAGGDLTTTLPDLGRNEFGDVARRLNTVTQTLRDQEENLAEEQRQITQALLSALPPRVVQRIRSGDSEPSDLLDTGTVISLSVTGLSDDAGIDQDLLVDLGSRLSRELEEAAGELGVERIRSSGTHHLFIAGLELDDHAADAAAQFARVAAGAVDRFADQLGVDIDYHASLASGTVASGLLTADQVTYGVFGDPPRYALALDAIAPPGQIMVHETTAAQLGPEWELEPEEGLVDLTGEPIAAMRLVEPPVEDATGEDAG